MSDDVKDKMAKARAAKKPPKYTTIHKDVPRDDDHYLSLKKVKEWQKYNRNRVKELKILIRKAETKKEERQYKSELLNREVYLKNINTYFDTGVWLDLFYGRDQQHRIQYKTVAYAYDAEGYVKVRQETPIIG